VNGFVLVVFVMRRSVAVSCYFPEKEWMTQAIRMGRALKAVSLGGYLPGLHWEAFAIRWSKVRDADSDVCEACEAMPTGRDGRAAFCKAHRAGGAT
jgi:hypothetical protein